MEVSSDIQKQIGMISFRDFHSICLKFNGLIGRMQHAAIYVAQDLKLLLLFQKENFSLNNKKYLETLKHMLLNIYPLFEKYV